MDAAPDKQDGSFDTSDVLRDDLGYLSPSQCGDLVFGVSRPGLPQKLHAHSVDPFPGSWHERGFDTSGQCWGRPLLLVQRFGRVRASHSRAQSWQCPERSGFEA